MLGGSIASRVPAHQSHLRFATCVPTELQQTAVAWFVLVTHTVMSATRDFMRTQETIRTLNRLIRTCRDGEDLCRIYSESVESAGLRTLLRFRSEEWARQGDELQALVLLLGGEPATYGSLGARLASAWTSLRTAVFGATDLPVLEQWQRVQQHSLDRYEEALSGYLPERIRRTVSLQADRVVDRFEQISALHGQYAVQSQTASHV
jgi:uncharacterized protein (TIGR02284 family)